MPVHVNGLNAPRFMPLLIEGDTAYGVEPDQYDVQYLVRYRIDRAPAPERR